MSLTKRNKVAAAIGAVALLISSSATAASAPQPVNPWAALSAMSAGSAASSAAAQSDVGVAARSNFGAPPLAALAVILGTIAVGLYIALDKAGHGRPSSPA